MQYTLMSDPTCSPDRFYQLAANPGLNCTSSGSSNPESNDFGCMKTGYCKGSAARAAFSQAVFQMATNEFGG